MYRRLIEKYKDRKIFKNMFVACFSLAAICILGFSVFGFVWFEKTQIEKEKRNYSGILYASSLMVDESIQAMQDMMEVLRNDTYIKKQLAKEDFSWDNEMKIAAGQIRNMLSVQAAFHSVYVIKGEDYLMKCTNASYPMDLAADQAIIRVFYDSSFGKYALAYYLGTDKQSKSILVLTDGEQNTKTGEKENGILIGLDIGEVMRQIIPQEHQGEQYILADAEGNIIYAVGESVINGEMLLKRKLETVTEMDDALRANVLEWEGGKYLVSAVDMETGFILIHLLPYKYVASTIDYMRITFLLIDGSIVIILLLAAFCMSCWVYNPIDRVVKTVNTPAGIREKAYEHMAPNELTSVAETYHMMLETLNDMNARQAQEDLARCLSSRSPNRALPEWVEETYGREGLRCRAICFRISDLKDMHDNNTDEAIAFEIQTIMHTIRQVLKPLGDILVTPIDREYIAVLVFSADSVEESSLMAEIREIFRITRELVYVGMDAGISAEKESFGEIVSMYQMARAATAYRFLYGFNAVITEEQMAKRALTRREKISLQRLEDRLKEGDRDSFWREYDRIIAEIKGRSLQAAREMLVSMMAKVLEYKNSLNYIFTPVTVEEYEALHKELSQFEYIDDVRSWFTKMADEIWMILDRAKLTGRDDIADKALKYLQENYADQNISAQYLADMYHITPSYFSRLFHERSGCAFPDYLSTLRIEKAKEMLLTEQGKSIQEICEMVGYSNSSYFTALFKKKYGITPGQFRKNHQKFHNSAKN